MTRHNRSTIVGHEVQKCTLNNLPTVVFKGALIMEGIIYLTKSLLRQNDENWASGEV